MSLFDVHKTLDNNIEFRCGLENDNFGLVLTFLCMYIKLSDFHLRAQPKSYICIIYVMFANVYLEPKSNCSKTVPLPIQKDHP